jgi:N-acetyl-anhydromuramyl-L-alanine amidase AmpD
MTKILDDTHPCERTTTPDVSSIVFIRARNYTPAHGRTISLIVLHTMEHPEVPNTARNVALWAAGPKAPQASWHYAIDDHEIVQCVRDQDVAWAAPGTNHNGIQIEHAGYAAQTSAQWNDAYSDEMLKRSVSLVATLCRRYNLPSAFVDAAGLLKETQAWGITTHREVTRACQFAQSRRLTTSRFFNAKKNVPLTSHTDPGANFPLQAYIEAVKALLGV